jgi:hypothetical protein
MTICDHCDNYGKAVKYEHACYHEVMCPLGQIPLIVYSLKHITKRALRKLSRR